MFWNHFSCKKLIEMGSLKISIKNKLSPAQKILIGILLLGVIGSISLLFNGIQNIIIFFVEKVILQRYLNNPAKWIKLMQTFAVLSIFFCSLLIVVVLFARKLVSWDKLSLITIIFFFVVGIMYAHIKAHFGGEADSYVIATISLQRHGSLDVREGDIHQLESEGYPEYLVERVRYKYENHRYVNDVYGKQYPFYMGTYSISVFPVKIINRLFNLPQTYVYHVSNVLYYSLALLAVYFIFRQTRKNIFLTILLLVCSPTFVYTSWASAEVFICSLMIVSLVFYTNGNRHLAAFFMSVASTLNITICGFGLVMLVDYFIYVLNNEKNINGKWNTVTVIKRNFKKTITLAICLIPALITPLWNFYHYHKITPQVGMAQYDVFWSKRFVSYLFDLNFGFLPYFPVLLALFFIIIIMGIFKKERQAIMLALGFFITVFLYSAMGHINCGMTAMARYNSWSFPFLVITVVSLFDRLFKSNKIQCIVVLLMLLSAGSSFALTKIVMDYNGGSHVHFTPIAKLFFDKAPALYNPYPFTFISRHQHYDGGYDRNANIPFVYYSDDGFARKILIPPKCDNPVSFLEFALSGAEKDMSRIIEQAKKLKIDHPLDWTYLNIPSKRLSGIYDNYDRDIFKESMRKPEDYPVYILGDNIKLANNKSIYQTVGWSVPEDWGTWTEGKTALLIMSIDSSDDLFLHLYIGGVFNSNPIDVSINNVFISSYEFVIGDNVIPIPKEIYPDKKIRIQFVFKNLKSPMNLGLSGDT